jgi:hypothetical protein
MLPATVLGIGLVVLAAVGCRARDTRSGPPQKPTRAAAPAATLGDTPRAPSTPLPSAAPPAPRAETPHKNPRLIAYAQPAVDDDHNIATKGCPQALALGRRAASAGEWDKASNYFLRAVGCDPTSALARGELGYAELRCGNVSNAIDVLRDAEGAAAGGAVQRAITHNLSKAYEATNAPELARRARLREARLQGEPAAAEDGSMCPVLVVPDDASIKQGSWLDAYQDIGFPGAAKPQTSGEARRLCCWIDSPYEGQKLSDACEDGESWTIAHWTSAFAALENVVWPLGPDRAAWSSAYRRGGTFCPRATASSASSVEARRIGDFLLVESSTSSYLPDFEVAPGTDTPCITSSTSRQVDLFDVSLKRGFSLAGLAADVQVELDPEHHALTLVGKFCGERIGLASVR